MKKIIAAILLIVMICALAGCAHEVEMLPELRCHKCGGEYRYDSTFTFLNDTVYYYICQTCGAKLRTETWRGK